ncbi:MAG TPA: ABC transporter substrate-binding protein [Acetobacteraceae bacterium]|jgi:phospholipid transport system substrate-binding protein|nr:ABC transporter substrate-binding protein [Acetobacteraceae bacterium]
MHDTTTRRRTLLGLAIVAPAAALPWRLACAQIAGAGDQAAPIRRLDDALLAAMKGGQATSFAQRFATLTPVIEQTFDLNDVLALSVGLEWSTLPDDQKPSLYAAFVRYTVASYAANFNNYSGQTFQVSPTVRSLGNGDVIVRTTIVATDGSTRKLDYRMRNGPAGWKAVDVLEDGSISRVAVQRSDFRDLLGSGGVPALMAALRQKVVTLSGGMLA